MMQPQMVAPLPNVPVNLMPHDMALVGDYVYIKLIDDGIDERYVFLDILCNVQFKMRKSEVVEGIISKCLFVIYYATCSKRQKTN